MTIAKKRNVLHIMWSECRSASSKLFSDCKLQKTESRHKLHKSMHNIFHLFCTVFILSLDLLASPDPANDCFHLRAKRHSNGYIAQKNLQNTLCIMTVWNFRTSFPVVTIQLSCKLRQFRGIIPKNTNCDQLFKSIWIFLLQTTNNSVPEHHMFGKRTVRHQLTWN